jgi:intracellular multiplication protein IcmE
MRYGSLFASSFLEGFGNAFQSANTTVTIGGTGGGNDVTIANGVGRSALENAVIGLATVGKTWGQQAQILMSKPTTVEVFAGTPVGILFIQDVKSI